MTQIATVTFKGLLMKKGEIGAYDVVREIRSDDVFETSIGCDEYRVKEGIKK